MPSTTPKGVPYAVGGDAAASIDTIMQTLAEWVDAAPGIASLSTAQRDALSGAALWTGRIIYNNTIGRLQAWTGSAWTSDLAVVSTAALNDLAVTTAKLADGAATLAKIAAAAYAVAPTPSLLVIRDAAGRTQVATPSDPSDATNKSYVDALGSVAASASTVVRRDAAGRAQIVTPSAAADISNKSYVDAGDAVLDGRLDAAEISVAELISPWNTLSLVNGWTTAPASNALRYKKIGNVVFLQGSLDASGKSSSTLGTMPVGYRPGAWARCIAEPGPITGSNGFVTVANTGVITCPATSVVTIVLVYPAEG